MTAEIIRIDHELPEFMFHCPLTGTPIVGDIDQSFERLASPYFLFSITEAGIVHSRSDELPKSIGAALKQVIDNLLDVSTKNASITRPTWCQSSDGAVHATAGVLAAEIMSFPFHQSICIKRDSGPCSGKSGSTRTAA